MQHILQICGLNQIESHWERQIWGEYNSDEIKTKNRSWRIPDISIQNKTAPSRLCMKFKAKRSLWYNKILSQSRCIHNRWSLKFDWDQFSLSDSKLCHQNQILPRSQHAILIGFWFKISLGAPKAPKFFGLMKGKHLVVLFRGHCWPRVLNRTKNVRY